MSPHVLRLCTFQWSRRDIAICFRRIVRIYWARRFGRTAALSRGSQAGPGSSSEVRCDQCGVCPVCAAASRGRTQTDAAIGLEGDPMVFASV